MIYITCHVASVCTIWYLITILSVLASNCYFIIIVNSMLPPTQLVVHVNIYRTCVDSWFTYIKIYCEDIRHQCSNVCTLYLCVSCFYKGWGSKHLVFFYYYTQWHRLRFNIKIYKSSKLDIVVLLFYCVPQQFTHPTAEGVSIPNEKNDS